MAQHNAIGKLGEETAKAYLKKKGYKFVEQNWKTKRAEIDLVMRQKSTLVFIEVRSKGGEQFGTPEDTIGWKKRRKLFNNAKAYTAIKGYAGLYRIDAVCVVFPGDGSITPARLSHYENIIEGRIA